MGGCTAAYWMLIMVMIVSVTGKPMNTMRTQKRQSDQRIAELETLLALQKYGAHHYLRQSGADGAGSVFPAYGIIDFNKIGRKKKSSLPSRDGEDDNVQRWAPSPSSSWAASLTHVNPSSNMIRLSSPRNAGELWKAALDPSTTYMDAFDEDNDN